MPSLPERDGPVRRWSRRLLVTLVAATAVFALFTLTWQSPLAELAFRIYVPAAACLLAYALFERWPRRLPPFLARWVLQVVAVALVVPIILFWFYLWSTAPGAPPFWHDPDRGASFGGLVLFGVLVSSWTAMSALMRERDAQVLRTERARAQVERQALDARLRLLQAQVEPHFLFNTLGALQSLVDSGSPRASSVLADLVAYLRAAVPRLDGRLHDIAGEFEIVRAYLALMQTRIPDRLQYSIDIDPALLGARCPQLAVMTLVENAVRHGIDPDVTGGRIDVTVRRHAQDACLVQVRDTGVGLGAGAGGTGTGLAALGERLQQVFPGRTRLRVAEAPPRGVLAEIEFPVEWA